MSDIHAYATDDAKWQAFEDRDANAAGHFFCAVKTTGIYCYPHCAARPHRKSVVFYASRQAAKRTGFRA
ncbi:MAG: Ada metal-binding domain-containing protein [Proteobacteria bacterium]|nr:Ada metal-binding domain-containing protein [Pseudomonadota bacterium]